MTTRFIIVEEMDAVGMHHWCIIQRGEILKLVREPDNPVDVNAVALQPLDRSIFGPFKTSYDKMCSEHLQNPDNMVTKITQPGLF